MTGLSISGAGRHRWTISAPGIGPSRSAFDVAGLSDGMARTKAGSQNRLDQLVDERRRCQPSRDRSHLHIAVNDSGSPEQLAGLCQSDRSKPVYAVMRRLDRAGMVTSLNSAPEPSGSGPRTDRRVKSGDGRIPVLLEANHFGGCLTARSAPRCWRRRKSCANGKYRPHPM